MKRFPKPHDFKFYVRKKAQDELANIARLIETSQNVHEFNIKLQNITTRDIQTIERRTRGQSNNPNCFFYRRGIITGTLTQRIVHTLKKRERNEKINAAISKIQTVQLYYPAIRYGRENEYHGIEAFIKEFKSNHFDVRVRQPGLLLDKSYPFIGGSADALISCSCCNPSILEIKCPYSLRDGSAIADGDKLVYLTDTLELRKKHSYYFQIQTYLGIYGYQKAYLGIWTPKDILIIEIAFDAKYWEDLKKDLCTYYYDYYLK